MTSKQRAFLRSLAVDIDTIIMVGKGNMNENIIKPVSYTHLTLPTILRV